MSHYGGYMGKVLKIDLADRTYGEFPWSDTDRERTIGGKIMAGDILYHHIKPGMTAFDEDNWLVITTGPLTGCGVACAQRFNISTISPLTGLITSSNSGGDFGIMLKRAGYDACVISGKSETPLWIDITEKKVEFKDASDLWGLEVTPTEEKLPKKAGKLVIGPAGENKVLYAAVLSGERCSGRGGVGAVFGDKKIKAITAFGFKQPLIVDEASMAKQRAKFSKTLIKHPLTGRQLPTLGSAGLVSPMQARGLLATKNFAKGKFDDFDDVSGETLAEEKLTRNSGCTSCVIQCSRNVMVDGKEVKGPELETLGLLGPNIMNNDLDSVIRWNHEIDELGMDTISLAGSLAFAMELTERGMLESDLKFGKIDNISETIRKIAFREGIGDDLANGSKRMSEKYGGEEFAIQSKGMELSAYEPRRAVGQGLGYAVSNRGGCHLNAGYLVFVEGLGLDIDSLTPSGKAEICIMFQNLMEAISAAGCCLFTSYTFFPGYVFDNPNAPITKAVTWAMPHLGPVLRLIDQHNKLAQLNIPLLPYPMLLKYSTGMRMNMGEFLVAGERGYNTERVANVILGQKPGADTLPERLTDVEQVEGRPETKVPLDKLLEAYYITRRWSSGGIPTRKKIISLKIDEPSRDIYPYD